MDYSPEDFGPRMQCVKQLEMSVRRAYALNAGLMDSLTEAGDLTTLKQGRLMYISMNKSLQEALQYRDYGKEDYAIHDQQTWEWMIDHWYSGALKRSVRATMHNMTETNRNNIKHKVRELHG